MVQLQGMTVRSPTNLNGDIEIVEVGLRPGEKLYEELLIEDGAMPTLHPSIFKASERFLPWKKLNVKLEELRVAVDLGERAQLIKLLEELVPEFKVDTPIKSGKGTSDKGMDKVERSE